MDGNRTYFGTRNTYTEGERELPLCELAQELERRLETLLGPLGENPTPRQIAQAKYLLQEQWQAWRKAIPPRHRHILLGKHRCLDEVYHATYERLHLLQLTTQLPNLIIDGEAVDISSSGATEARTTQIAGIFIGEEE